MIKAFYCDTRTEKELQELVQLMERSLSDVVRRAIHLLYKQEVEINSPRTEPSPADD